MTISLISNKKETLSVNQCNLTDRCAKSKTFKQNEQSVQHDNLKCNVTQSLVSMFTIFIRVTRDISAVMAVVDCAGCPYCPPIYTTRTQHIAHFDLCSYTLILPYVPIRSYVPTFLRTTYYVIVRSLGPSTYPYSCFGHAAYTQHCNIENLAVSAATL